jgi:hypothetical protein
VTRRLCTEFVSTKMTSPGKSKRKSLADDSEEEQDEGLGSRKHYSAAIRHELAIK